MDEEKIHMLVQQWLKEKGYDNALGALQKESGIVSGDAEVGGQLLSVLYEHAEMKASLLESAPEDLLQGEKRAAEEELIKLPLEVPVPTEHGHVFSHIHAGNIIACQFNCTGGHFATGSSDTSVKILCVQQKKVLRTINTHGAPVLSVSFHPSKPHLLLSTAMDGTTALSHADKTPPEVLQTWKDHQKYVTRAVWARDGSAFATCSHDKSAVVYRLAEGGTEDEPKFEKKQMLQFTSIPEAMEFLDDSMTLVVSVRGDNYLHYIDIDTGDVNKANLNALGDDHVSFTVLDLSLSPNGKWLLASTDKSRLLLYTVGTTMQLRYYYGAVNDDLCQTRACWHPSGAYIYVTSQDHKVYCWHVASQKLVSRLVGHAAAVRDIAMSGDGKTLVSCAFDKTVRFWTIPE